MTDSLEQLRTLLARLITDGAHHAQCADRSRIDEARIAHSGMAAGFHIAAVYTADLIVHGQLRARGGHPAQPEHETAAREITDRLPADPGERAQAIGDLMHTAGPGRP